MTFSFPRYISVSGLIELPEIRTRISRVCRSRRPSLEDTPHQKFCFPARLLNHGWRQAAGVSQIISRVERPRVMAAKSFRCRRVFGCTLHWLHRGVKLVAVLLVSRALRVTCRARLIATYCTAHDPMLRTSQTATRLFLFWLMPLRPQALMNRWLAYGSGSLEWQRILTNPFNCCIVLQWKGRSISSDRAHSGETDCRQDQAERG